MMMMPWSSNLKSLTYFRSYIFYYFSTKPDPAMLRGNENKKTIPTGRIDPSMVDGIVFILTLIDSKEY